MAKIWLDLKNCHEPPFFASLIKKLQNHEFFVTIREREELGQLVEKAGLEYHTIGSRAQGTLPKRLLIYFGRFPLLYFKVPRFDVSLSHFSGHGILLSRMLRRPHIAFTDNDIAHSIYKKTLKHLRYLIMPEAISRDVMVADGMVRENIRQYDGFKEDIYIAGYQPDPDFLERLPFKEFVTVRPESTQAVYYPKGVPSLVPRLLKALDRENVNILFLPRYESDKEYAKGIENIYTPPEPLKGLDVCYYSKTVLTGAGTFAREAACMGTPAVSFFPGKQLGAVDYAILDKGWMIHSLETDEIIDYIMSAKNRQDDLSRSKAVRQEVLQILETLFEDLTRKK